MQRFLLRFHVRRATGISWLTSGFDRHLRRRRRGGRCSKNRVMSTRVSGPRERESLRDPVPTSTRCCLFVPEIEVHFLFSPRTSSHLSSLSFAVFSSIQRTHMKNDWKEAGNNGRCSMLCGAFYAVKNLEKIVWFWYRPPAWTPILVLCPGVVVVHFVIFFFVGSKLCGWQRKRILFADVGGRKGQSHICNDDAVECWAITSPVFASCLCARTCCCVIPCEHALCYASCLLRSPHATRSAAAAAHHVRIFFRLRM